MAMKKQTAGEKGTRGWGVGSKSNRLSDSLSKLMTKCTK